MIILGYEPWEFISNEGQCTFHVRISERIPHIHLSIQALHQPTCFEDESSVGDEQQRACRSAALIVKERPLARRV